MTKVFCDACNAEIPDTSQRKVRWGDGDDYQGELEHVCAPCRLELKQKFDAVVADLRASAAPAAE